MLIMGGLISGSFDAYSTNKVGNVARDLFITKKLLTPYIIPISFDQFYPTLSVIIKRLSCQNAIPASTPTPTSPKI